MMRLLLRMSRSEDVSNDLLLLRLSNDVDPLAGRMTPGALLLLLVVSGAWLIMNLLGLLIRINHVLLLGLLLIMLLRLLLVDNLLVL